jgi:N-acetylmuramic acid 6-phosphate (MurNAc-6-P) etherase
MIGLGKTSGGAMTHVRAMNAKLRDRATRIVATAREIEPVAARALLEKHDWDIPAALAQPRSP